MPLSTRIDPVIRQYCFLQSQVNDAVQIATIVNFRDEVSTAKFVAQLQNAKERNHGLLTYKDAKQIVTTHLRDGIYHARNCLAKLNSATVSTTEGIANSHDMVLLKCLKRQEALKEKYKDVVMLAHVVASAGNDNAAIDGTTVDETLLMSLNLLQKHIFQLDRDLREAHINDVSMLKSIEIVASDEGFSDSSYSRQLRTQLLDQRNESAHAVQKIRENMLLQRKTFFEEVRKRETTPSTQRGRKIRAIHLARLACTLKDKQQRIQAAEVDLVGSARRNVALRQELDRLKRLRTAGRDRNSVTKGEAIVELRQLETTCGLMSQHMRQRLKNTIQQARSQQHDHWVSKLERIKAEGERQKEALQRAEEKEHYRILTRIKAREKARVFEGVRKCRGEASRLGQLEQKEAVLAQVTMNYNTRVLRIQALRKKAIECHFKPRRLAELKGQARARWMAQRPSRAATNQYLVTLVRARRSSGVSLKMLHFMRDHRRYLRGLAPVKKNAEALAPALKTATAHLQNLVDFCKHPKLEIDADCEARIGIAALDLLDQPAATRRVQLAQYRLLVQQQFDTAVHTVVGIATSLEESMAAYRAIRSTCATTLGHRELEFGGMPILPIVELAKEVLKESHARLPSFWFAAVMSLLPRDDPW